MSDIKLNSEGDIDLTNMEMTLVEDEDAIAQEVKISMRFFQGEWFLDTRVGIPYFQKILTGEKTDRLDLIAAIYRRALLSIPGVILVDTVSVAFDNDATLRKINVEWQAQIDGGQVIDGIEALVLP